MMENISFQDVREAMPQLLSIIYSAKDRKLSYEIGFLPSSDRDVYLINNDKVRMICPALECELSFIDDICPKEETDLQGLIKNVKHLVKAHRKSPHKLSNKTYDLIFSILCRRQHNFWILAAQFTQRRFICKWRKQPYIQNKQNQVCRQKSHYHYFCFFSGRLEKYPQ